MAGVSTLSGDRGTLILQFPAPSNFFLAHLSLGHCARGGWGYGKSFLAVCRKIWRRFAEYLYWKKTISGHGIKNPDQRRSTRYYCSTVVRTSYKIRWRGEATTSTTTAVKLLLILLLYCRELTNPVPNDKMRPQTDSLRHLAVGDILYSSSRRSFSIYA